MGSGVKGALIKKRKNTGGRVEHEDVRNSGGLGRAEGMAKRRERKAG